MSKAPHVSSLKACATTRDAARSAAEVVFVTTSSYPMTFTAMTTGNTPVLIANDGTTVTAHTIAGKGWVMTMKGGGSTPPKLTCANTPVG